MMMKLLALLVVVLSVARAATAAEVVRCLPETAHDTCGKEQTDPCKAFAVAGGEFQVDDLVYITYSMPEVDSVLCEAPGCTAFSNSIFAKIIEGTPTAGVTIELRSGGAETLCPSNCLDETASVWFGICQPNVDSDGGCVTPEAHPRKLICSLPLGAHPDTNVEVQCVSGPSCPSKVTCLADSSRDICGADRTNPCQAFAHEEGVHRVGDLLVVTYAIEEAFDDPVCDVSASGKRCVAFSTSIYVEIVEGIPSSGAEWSEVELTSGGVESLCTWGCLDSTGDVFGGICQPSTGDYDRCVKHETYSRDRLCSHGLGTPYPNVKVTVTPTTPTATTTLAPQREVVQCEAETEITSCGGTVDDPCQAKASATARKYVLGDKLKITYEIPTAFAGDGKICVGALGNLNCDVYSKVVYVVVGEGKPTAEGIDVQISESAAHVLCPQNCLDSKSEVFAGICQVGEGYSDGCLYPDLAVSFGPRNYICKVPLGHAAKATASVECVSGACLDEGSAVALSTGAAALCASLFAVAMHVV